MFSMWHFAHKVVATNWRFSYPILSLKTYFDGINSNPFQSVLLSTGSTTIWNPNVNPRHYDSSRSLTRHSIVGSGLSKNHSQDYDLPVADQGYQLLVCNPIHPIVITTSICRQNTASLRIPQNRASDAKGGWPLSKSTKYKSYKDVKPDIQIFCTSKSNSVS